MTSFQNGTENFAIYREKLFQNMNPVFLVLDSDSYLINFKLKQRH